MTKALSATQLKRFESQLREKSNRKLLTEYGYNHYDTDGYQNLYDDIVGKKEVTVSTKRAGLITALTKKKLSKRTATRIAEILSAIADLEDSFDLTFLSIPAVKAYIKALEAKNDARVDFLNKVKQHNDQVNADTQEILNEAIFRDAEWAIEALKNY
jgi:hypothetical protein